MVEYGNGVGEVAGRSTGGGGSQSMDVGAALAQAVNDSVTTLSTLSTMPPVALLAGVVVVIVGLMLVKKAS